MRMNEKIQAFHQHILKVHTGLIKPEVSIWCGAQFTEQSSTVFHKNRNKKGVNYMSARFVMRFWESNKKRLNKPGRMKVIKKKVTAGLELVAVGGLLSTGNSDDGKTNRDIISTDIGPRCHLQLQLRYGLDKVPIIVKQLR